MRRWRSPWLSFVGRGRPRPSRFPVHWVTVVRQRTPGLPLHHLMRWWRWAPHVPLHHVWPHRRAPGRSMVTMHGWAHGVAFHAIILMRWPTRTMFHFPVSKRWPPRPWVPKPTRRGRAPTALVGERSTTVHRRPPVSPVRISLFFPVFWLRFLPMRLPSRRFQRWSTRRRFLVILLLVGLLLLSSPHLLLRWWRPPSVNSTRPLRRWLMPLVCLLFSFHLFPMRGPVIVLHLLRTGCRPRVEATRRSHWPSREASPTASARGRWRRRHLAPTPPTRHGRHPHWPVWMVEPGGRLRHVRSRWSWPRQRSGPLGWPGHSAIVVAAWRRLQLIHRVLGDISLRLLLWDGRFRGHGRLGDLCHSFRFLDCFFTLCPRFSRCFRLAGGLGNGVTLDEESILRLEDIIRHDSFLGFSFITRLFFRRLGQLVFRRRVSRCGDLFDLLLDFRGCIRFGRRGKSGSWLKSRRSLKLGRSTRPLWALKSSRSSNRCRLGSPWGLIKPLTWLKPLWCIKPLWWWKPLETISSRSFKPRSSRALKA